MDSRGDLTDIVVEDLPDPGYLGTDASKLSTPRRIANIFPPTVRR